MGPERGERRVDIYNQDEQYIEILLLAAQVYMPELEMAYLGDNFDPDSLDLDKLPSVFITGAREIDQTANKIKRLKAEDSPFKEIPIAVLTSHTRELAEEDLLAAGADIFISKDQKPEEIFSSIKGLLEKDDE